MEKQKTLINFRKALGTVQKIIKMTEENQYCINIMQQNLAAIGLLKSAHQALLENHLKTCFKNKMNSKSNKQQDVAIDEVLKVSKLSNK